MVKTIVLFVSVSVAARPDLLGYDEAITRLERTESERLLNLDTITPVVLTLDEEPNIKRLLESLRWAQRVVMVDSGSTDGTLAIAKEFANVEVIHREFDQYKDQWNFGLQQADTEWILSLDADYVLSEELLSEIKSLEPACDAFRIPFRFSIFGKALKRNLLPPRVALFRQDRASYVQDGHTQLLSCQGTVGDLAGWIYHDDRKSIGRWLRNQIRYARDEAEKLEKTGAGDLPAQDRLRQRIFFAPLAVVVYGLFFRMLIFEGLPGFYYVMQRCVAESILSLTLLDRKLRR